MLNRRHLRVKALQALYSYFQGGEFDIGKSENELKKSVEKVYELYLSKLQFLVELKHAAQNIIEINKAKLLPTPEDLNPNLSFVNNSVLKVLESNEAMGYMINSRKISWADYRDVVKKIFLQIAESDEYKAYMAKPEKTFKDDRNFIVEIFSNYVAENELLEFIYEEQSIFWLDDFYLVNTMVIKTLKEIKPTTQKTDDILLNLFNDPDDEKEFLLKLFRLTIVNTDKYQEYIESKLKNWEPERIALMDMIIMKMALAELINFPSIPVKVTLNEYIELSKDYSTNKSKIFVNGILDKLVPDLKAKGEIVKVGRGLVE